MLLGDSCLLEQACVTLVLVRVGIVNGVGDGVKPFPQRRGSITLDRRVVDLSFLDDCLQRVAWARRAVLSPLSGLLACVSRQALAVLA